MPLFSFYIDSPKEALASVSIGFILLRVLAIVLLIVLNTWILLKITPSVLTAARKRVAATGAMLLIGGVLFIIIRGGSYRVDFQRRSGVFQQRAVFESFGCQS